MVSRLLTLSLSLPKLPHAVRVLLYRSMVAANLCSAVILIVTCSYTTAEVAVFSFFLCSGVVLPCVEALDVTWRNCIDTRRLPLPGWGGGFLWVLFR